MKPSAIKNSENLLIEIYTSNHGDISFGVSSRTPEVKKRKARIRARQKQMNRKFTWN